jgi:phosphinothricin acetyltransferase
MIFKEKLMKIRYAKLTDLQELVHIYNYYVENSHSTFAERPFTLNERKDWLLKYKDSGPYKCLVAEEDEKILGYTYSSIYREHPAFRETIETSIYLSEDSRGKGLGTTLYSELFNALKDESLHLAVVGIALPNDSSVQLHKKLGFEEVGIFNEYAKVHGKYYSSIWMQKALGN